MSSRLTLKLFKPPLQLVVVEGGLARESGVGAGPPDGAEAGAGTPAGACERGAGATRRGGQGAWIVHGRGERAGGKRAAETAGGALKLHDPRFRLEESTEASRTDSAQKFKCFQTAPS